MNEAKRPALKRRLAGLLKARAHQDGRRWVTVTVHHDTHQTIKSLVGSGEKQCGKGAIMSLGEEDKNIDIRVISTGSVALDYALGVGGYPRGRIVEIYGPESSGKTTLALHAMREAQRGGGIAAFIDA